MKSKILIFSFVLSCSACKTPAPTVKESETSKPSFSYELLVSSGDSLPYRLLLPKNYDKSKAYPLVLFLHGAGERGIDNELQLVHGADLFLQAETRQNFPAIVVFPQCPKNERWSNCVWTNDGSLKFNSGPEVPVNKNQVLLKALLADLNQTYKLDHQRLYVGGLSMGGMGTFEIVRQNPKRFAAAFPICGGADPTRVENLISTKWWIFHGEDDQVILPENSINMYEALKSAGADAQLNLYPNTGHDSWTNTFAEPELLKWLFAQKL